MFTKVWGVEDKVYNHGKTSMSKRLDVTQVNKISKRLFKVKKKTERLEFLYVIH